MIQEEVCSEEDDDAFDTCSEAASSCPQSPLVAPRQISSSVHHQPLAVKAVGVDETVLTAVVSSAATVEVEPPSSTSSSSSDDDDEYEAFRINR